MFPISTTQSSLFQSIRYSTTELADQRICVDSLRHQRSDYSIMVVLFRSGLLLQNLAHFKIIDEELNSHMEHNGEFALAAYFQNARLQVQPVIYTKRPVPMHPVDSDRGRHVIIEESLASLLPITSIDLVNDYAQDHESFFTDPGMWSGSDNCSLKRKTLRKAIERGEQAVLNEVFEELRQSNQPVDLSWVDLSGLNLTGLNLFGVILVSANLTDTNLTRADLRQADLSDADLTGANLFDAALNSAVLIRADLTLANCEQADLSDASLFETIFHRTNLRCAWLLGANLSGASMCGTNLNRAVLQGANLHNADLSGSSMANANLFQANLSGACLAFCHLAHANLMYANLTETNFQSACLFNAKLHKATMHGASFWLANLAVANGYDEIPAHIGKATAHLSRLPSMTTTNQRRSVTQQALFGQIPTSLIDLIRAYEGHTDSGRLHTFAEKSNRSAAHFRTPELDYAPVSDIENRCRSREFVLNALISGDVRLKGQIIRTLISKNKSRYLNKIFDEIRKRHGHITLSSVDLSRLNLSNLNLSDSDLSWANLNQVRIIHGWVSNSDLSYADLSAAVIAHTRLTRVVLFEADVSGTEFRQCTIECSILASANFSGTNIRARFRQNFIHDTNFSAAELSQTHFIGSHLIGVDMTGATLNGVSIRNSTLTNVKTDNVNLFDVIRNKMQITEPSEISD